MRSFCNPFYCILSSAFSCYNSVLRRDVVILGRSVFGVLLSVRQLLLCIDTPEELFHGRPDCLYEI